LKNLSILLLIPTILFSSLFVLPAVPQAFASGIVCLAPNGSSTCGAPALFTGTVGSTLRVAVVVSGAGAINGFDISIKADRSFIKATGADLTGSVLGVSPRTVLLCIDGVVVSGNNCPATDTIGTIDFAAATGNGGTVSTSGLLFTAIYTVTGSTTGTPVDFTPGCTGSSATNTCVTITNGNGATPVATQGGTFGNLLDFTISASPNPIQVAPSTTGSVVLTLNSLGGYSDLVNLAITAFTIPSSVTPTQVDLASVTTNTATLSVGPAAAGVYQVTVTATGSGTFSPTFKPTHAVTVEVDVASTNFALSASPSSLTIPHGSSDTSALTVTPITGFTGTVTFAAVGSNAAITGSAGPVTGGSGTSILTVSVAFSLAPGIYSITVTGTSGSITHSVTIPVTVPGPFFGITAVPAAISAPRISAATTVINVASINNYQGTVTVTGSQTSASTDHGAGAGANPILLMFPGSVTLSPGSTFGVAFEAHTSPSTATGNFTFTITATDGTLTAPPLTILVNVFDFTVGPSYCSGNTIIFTTPNGNNPTVGIGHVCDTLVITNQTEAQGGVPGTLWQSVGSLGGYASNGFQGTGSVAAFNAQVPARGIRVPELGHKVCFVQTFWANGTQIPYSYLRLNGPVIRGGSFTGCRFDAAAFINDQAGGFAGVLDPPAPQTAFNNTDFWQITAEALSNTQLGNYTFIVCGQAGLLVHCKTYTLVVVAAPVIHQFNFDHRLSLSGSANTQTFKVGISSVDLTNTLYIQITITGIDQNGDTFTVSSPLLTFAPGATINNIIVTATFNKSEIGQTFSFSTSLSVGVSAEPTTQTGFSSVSSTLQALGRGLPINSSFIVLA
jgi:hypothetical protein